MPDEMFTTVRRGYDPAEVERAVEGARTEVAELRARLAAAEGAAEQARTEADEARTGLEQARSEASAAREALVAREAQQPEQPTFAHLGERVGQILSLAEAEGRRGAGPGRR